MACAHDARGMFFLALRDLRFSTGRFALMGAVVTLISFLLVMLSGLTAGLAHQSISAIDELPADRIVFGAAEGDDPEVSFTQSRVTQDDLDAYAAVDGVSKAAALGVLQGRVEADGTTAVTVFGADPDSDLAPAALSDGKAVISEDVATERGLSVGDDFSLSGVDMTVGQIVPTQWYSHTPVIWTSLADWATVAHIPEQADVLGTALAVSLDSSADKATADDALDAAASDTDTVVTDLSGARSGLPAFTSEHSSLLMMQGFLYGISALVVVAFLSIWTVQRTRDIAVLKALGASGGYVLRDALIQAGIILLIGILVGAGLGLGAGLAAGTAVPFVTSINTTLLPAIGVLVVGMLGAVLAVRRVTSVDPLIALGGS